ncbi:MAG TPA: hypothetical protein VHC90_03410 [Bryobacteraceae bacterium]|nr:hypothetical protein [Bryobacteraceae bacterium]
MTDWKTLAAIHCPDIPCDAVERIAPSLDALEQAFRPLAAILTPADESALTFSNVQERAK